MNLTIKEVQSKKDINQFIKLPFELYKNNPFWIPPILKDERKALDLKTNPAYEFCEAKFFIVHQDNKCVGRLGAIINKNYNAKIGEKFGRLNRFEFIDDFEVSKLLVETAAKWFKEKGMTQMHGPLGFTNLDTQGLLIEGFDYLPSIASVYHLPYYQNHFEKLNFEKENDWIEFRLKLTENVYNKGLKGAELIKKRFGFDVVIFSDKKSLEEYKQPIFDILNEAFDKLPYVTSLNGKMRQLYIDKYFSILNPNFVKVVLKDKKPVGFFIGLPSLSRAMQKANGKLFPFGFTHILKALKNPEIIDMLLTGVDNEHQNAGVAVVLISALQEEMKKFNIDTMETTGVFETNQNVITNWKNYEHIQHKRRRCYKKVL